MGYILNQCGLGFENFRDILNKFADFGLIALMPVIDDNTSMRLIKFEGNDFPTIITRCNNWSQTHQLGNRCKLVEFLNAMTTQMRTANNRKRINNLSERTSRFKFKHIKKFIKGMHKYNNDGGNLAHLFVIFLIENSIVKTVDK